MEVREPYLVCGGKGYAGRLGKVAVGLRECLIGTG